jgi:hypothetical protein
VCAESTWTSAASDRDFSLSSSGTTTVAYRAKMGGIAAAIVTPTLVALLIHATSTLPPIRGPCPAGSTGTAPGSTMGRG